MITDLIRDMIVDEIALRLDPASLRYFASTCKKLYGYFEDFERPTAKDILSEGHLTFAEVVLNSRSCSLPNSVPPSNWSARVWWYVRNPFHDSIQSVFKYNRLRPDMCSEDLDFQVLHSLVEAKRDDLVRDFINSNQLGKYDSNMMDTLFFAILGRNDYIDVFQRFAVLPQVTVFITDAYEVQRLLQYVDKENVSRLLNLVATNEAFATSFREVATSNNYGSFWPRVFYVKACKIVGVTPLPLPKSYSNNNTLYSTIIARNLKDVIECLPWLEEGIADKRKVIKSFSCVWRVDPQNAFDTVFVEMWRAFDEAGWIDETLIKRKDLMNLLIRRSLADLHFLRKWAEVRHPKMARFIGAFLEFA